jgi:hypothetical protein
MILLRRGSRLDQRAMFWVIGECSLSSCTSCSSFSPSSLLVLTSSSPSYFQKTKSWTQTINATASFTFNGTSITLIGAKRANHGNYTVQLDDGREEEFSGREPDPGVFQTALYSRDGLDGEKVHTVVLKNLARGEEGFLDLDAVRLGSIRFFVALVSLAL